VAVAGRGVGVFVFGDGAHGIGRIRAVLARSDGDTGSPFGIVGTVCVRAVVNGINIFPDGPSDDMIALQFTVEQ
jgi:hypothetical protein